MSCPLCLRSETKKKCWKKENNINNKWKRDAKSTDKFDNDYYLLIVYEEILILTVANSIFAIDKIATYIHKYV